MIAERLRGWDADELVSLADCGVVGGREGNIVSTCEQGTAEWLTMRRGCLTASKCSVVIGIKGEPSKSATRDTYMYELAAERITGSATDTFVNAAMQRGTELEPMARQWYVDHYGPVREVGFVFRDPVTRDIGASPDGLCENGGLEIKCLLPSTHARHLHKMALAKDPAAVVDLGHRMQCQFSMFVTGLKQWDYCLYSPPILSLPCRVVTIHADEKLHDCMSTYLPEFCAEVSAAVDAIRKEGGAA